MAPLIPARSVHAVERANVQLVQDIVVERGRMKTFVVPGESGRRADKTIAVGIGRVDAESASTRITFKAGPCAADNPEPVGVAFSETGEKRAPGIIAQVEKLIGGGRSEAWRLRGGKRCPGKDVHLAGGGS